MMVHLWTLGTTELIFTILCISFNYYVFNKNVITFKCWSYFLVLDVSSWMVGLRQLIYSSVNHPLQQLLMYGMGLQLQYSRRHRINKLFNSDIIRASGAFNLGIFTFCKWIIFTIRR